MDISLKKLFNKIDILIDRNDVILIAVDGRSGAGKTTLSELIAEKYGCIVFHMDDFFLRPEQRTPERYAETGGNIDYERFLSEILIPLKKCETINFRRFNCAEMKLCDSILINPSKLTVIEGVYSMHPLFRDYYNYSVFLDVSSDLQKKRILSRNSPEKAELFFNQWIPLENTYFLEENIKDKCDMIIEQYQ